MVVTRENVVIFMYTLGAVLGGMYLERHVDGLGDVGALIVASVAAVALVAYYNYSIVPRLEYFDERDEQTAPADREDL